MLKPFEARLMRCYPVSARINHMANDDEGCAAPIKLTEGQGHLFFFTESWQAPRSNFYPGPP